MNNKLIKIAYKSNKNKVSPPCVFSKDVICTIADIIMTHDNSGMGNNEREKYGENRKLDNETTELFFLAAIKKLSKLLIIIIYCHVDITCTCTVYCCAICYDVLDDNERCISSITSNSSLFFVIGSFTFTCELNRVNPKQ